MSFTSPTLLAGLAALAIVVLTVALIPVLRHRELNEGQKWDVSRDTRCHHEGSPKLTAER